MVKTCKLLSEKYIEAPASLIAYNITNMLHLGVIDKKYTGLYYNLAQQNLWSKKLGDKNYLKVSGHFIVVGSEHVSYNQIINEVQKFLKRKKVPENGKNMDCDNALDSKSDHYANTLDGIKNHGFIIAVVEGETVCFNLKPKVHKTEESARAEVIRLSAKFPNKHFAYFQAMGIASVKVNWEK